MVEKLDESRQVKVRGRNADFTGTICAVNVIKSAKVTEGKKQSCAMCVLKSDLGAMHLCDGTDHQVSEIPAGVFVKRNEESGGKIFCKYGDILYNCKKS